MAFNKMFIMLPVMLAARKLDGEDPSIVFLLRCLYAAVQTASLLLVLYVYRRASAAASDNTNKVVIYVPPPPQPFKDPNEPVTYQETALSDQLLTSARGLLGSTAFGICMTVGLHLWKGMIVGLAIQSIMAPFNLYENPLVKAVLRGGLDNLKEKRIFGEKWRGELNDKDTVTDREGNAIVLKEQKSTASDKKKDFEDILLDTWDAGSEADVKSFLAVLTERNINHVTKENSWSPVSVISGLGAAGVGEALKRMKDLGANPHIVDKEGWNALHWVSLRVGLSVVGSAGGCHCFCNLILLYLHWSKWADFIIFYPRIFKITGSFSRKCGSGIHSPR
jgi:hypothetical protein